MTELTVCVPAFNAGAFLVETLNSISAQSLGDFKVLISLDRSDDDSEAVCRRHLADPRFQLIVQSERLDWVRNCNALIKQVDTPYFCITPHDDLLGVDYLAKTLMLAKSDPAIACAYSDIEGFGSRRVLTIQREVRGTTLERATDVLLNHFHAAAFRGVVRHGRPDDRPYLHPGLRRNFAADTVWLMTLALRGELRRLPAVHYRKRCHPTSVHAAWSTWPRAELIVMWAEQCAALVRIALTEIQAPADREVILLAGLMRVVGVGGFTTFATPSHPLECATAGIVFGEALQDFPPPAELPKVLMHPEARHLREAMERDDMSRAAMRNLLPRLLHRIRGHLRQLLS